MCNMHMVFKAILYNKHNTDMHYTDSDDVVVWERMYMHLAFKELMVRATAYRLTTTNAHAAIFSLRELIVLMQ